MNKIIAGISLIGAIIAFSATPTIEEEQPELIKVSTTAYYDVNGYGHGANGQPLVEGLTIAGRKDWIGKTAALYTEDMELIGYYEFRDTGYGQPTGAGQSKLLSGKTIGTIENGTCIDIYFTSYEKCKAWGRKTVYMQLIEARG